MRFGLKSAVAGAAAFAVLASSGTSFALLSDLTPGSDLQKTAGKCFATIQKELAKYAAGHAKKIVKCKAAIIKGKVVDPGFSTCNPLSGDLAGKDGDAILKLASKIAGKCGGSDKDCTTTGDNISLADISWNFGTCRDLEGQGGGGAIADCSDIVPCAVPNIKFANHQVLNDIAADVLADGIFGDGGAGKNDNKCQQALFKEINKFYLAKIKTVGKCWQTKGKLKVGSGFDDTDPCPDTDPKGKASAAIVKIEQKLAKGLCGKCSVEAGVPLKLGDGNKDGVCDGADKITPVAIAAGDLQWFTGLTCPSVTVPPSDVLHRYDNPAIPGISYGDGVASNGADCGAIGTIDSLQEYIDCATCVAEYKADCVLAMANGEDAGLGMVYPADCLGGGVTPCGNGVLDVGEACDASAPGPDDICPNAGNGNQACQPDCTCNCPAVVTFQADANDPSSLLDTGFTGFAHNSKVIGLSTVTVALSGGTSGAAGKRDPDCGVMDIAGPLPNPAANAGQNPTQLCSGDSSISCTADSDCPGAETCDDYFGSRLPLSAGGVSACVTNRFVAPISGTANIETGTSANTVSLASTVHVGPSVDKPCANCIGDDIANDGVRGGTCDADDRAGMACDVQGVSPVPAFNGGVPAALKVNGTSHDCPKATGDVGVLPIDLSNSTGSESITVEATGPTCSAAGFGGSTCMCDTCATAAAEPCNADSDCPVAITCGGLRCLGGANSGTACTTPGIGDPACAGAPCGGLGEPTKPNVCTSTVCTAGACATGPFNGFCGPTETFRGCLAPSDCPFAGDTCGFIAQPCFDDNGVVGGVITATGAPDVPVNDVSSPSLASAFCVGPVGASAINAASGLPGAARVTLTGTANGLP